MLSEKDCSTLFFRGDAFPLGERIPGNWVRSRLGGVWLYNENNGLEIRQDASYMFCLHSPVWQTIALSVLAEHERGRRAWTWYWAAGIPVWIGENADDCIEALLHTDLDALEPPPYLHHLSHLFFRGYCARPNNVGGGDIVPWWAWEEEWKATCFRNHRVPNPRCTCGFYGTYNPRLAIYYTRYARTIEEPQILICSPTQGARVVYHTRGLRTSHYCVVAVVAALNSPYNGPNVTKALNLTARALEVVEQIRVWERLQDD